jgi:pyridoxamine 5'-phosphate oxidase
MEEKEFSVNTLIGGNRGAMGENLIPEQGFDRNPFVEFEKWLHTALEKDPYFANAMVLSTTGRDQMPDSRVVLLRNISYGGFTFYTNYQSKKGRDIAENSQACLLFFWKEGMQQVKIQGEIRFLPAKESDDYFAARPFENQVGAWASQQSRIVANRQALDDAFNREMKQYKGKKVPRPPHWGGYVLLPSSFEFWQGREGRLHDRMRYGYSELNKQWQIERLMP